MIRQSFATRNSTVLPSPHCSIKGFGIRMPRELPILTNSVFKVYNLRNYIVTTYRLVSNSQRDSFLWTGGEARRQSESPEMACKTALAPSPLTPLPDRATLFSNGCLPPRHWGAQFASVYLPIQLFACKKRRCGLAAKFLQTTSP